MALSNLLFTCQNLNLVNPLKQNLEMTMTNLSKELTICRNRFSIILTRLEVPNVTKKMVQTGCLTRVKLQSERLTMFSALHHTESRFFASSQGISANIPSLLNMMAVRLGRKFAKRQSGRCIISVLGEACMRSGDISGQGGTHQKCGASGHDQLCHWSLIYKQLWGLKTSGGS